jgi:tetratricopeptide (TPR) repeat protein
MAKAKQTQGSSSELNALYAQATREHQAGRLAEATATYRKILAQWPGIPEVHNNLGIALCQQGQFDQALPRFEQAVALKPDLPDAHNNLANLLRQQGHLEQAAARYQRVIALRPDFVEAYNNLGNILLELGQLDQAQTRFEQAIARRPDYAEAHYNLGNVLGHQGQLERAAARFEQAIALRPGYAEAHKNLGNLLGQQGKFDQALARFEQAFALWPDDPDAHNNLGKVLLSLGRLDEAAAHYELALALRPDGAEAHNNLGTIRWQQNKFDEAVARFEQAIALWPDYADAHKNLGNVFVQQGKFEPAAVRFEQAIALRPNYADAQVGLATCYLIAEDYRRGWPAYEARLRMPWSGPQPDLPRWTGQPLAGRSLLLVAEQGLGDTIQFFRYARALKQRGARVVLACPMALGRLITGHPDLDELYLPGCSEEMLHCDFYLPLLSVPGALGTDTSTIPCEVPYLSADPELVEKWRQELSAVNGFKIGIVWQGSRSYPMDRWRSIALAEFAPLARLPEVRLISLQKGFGSEQIAKVDFPVLDLCGRLDEATGPFVDTAAVIQNLDLVITPDSVMAHLAGALGAPVWVALQLSAEWRWLRGRDDSPWYPTMRLFRQTTLGEWRDVFAGMAKAIESRRSETASSPLSQSQRSAASEGKT